MNDGPAGTYYGSGASTVIHAGRAMSLTSGCATRRAAGRATSWTSGRDTRWAAGRSCRTAGCATVGQTSAPPSRWAFRPVTPPVDIGRRCSESPGIGLAGSRRACGALGATRARPAGGDRDTRAAQRMLVPPRSRRASGGTQYATMQPHLKVLQCSVLSHQRRIERTIPHIPSKIFKPDFSPIEAKIGYERNPQIEDRMGME